MFGNRWVRVAFVAGFLLAAGCNSCGRPGLFGRWRNRSNGHGGPDCCEGPILVSGPALPAAGGPYVSEPLNPAPGNVVPSVPPGSPQAPTMPYTPGESTKRVRPGQPTSKPAPF